MELVEIIGKVIQDMVLPDLEVIKAENKEIKIALLSMSNRMNDMNAHLVDQSRRIDQLRVELKEEINQLRVELKEEIAKTNLRIDGITNRMDGITI